MADQKQNIYIRKSLLHLTLIILSEVKTCILKVLNYPFKINKY